MSWEVEALRFSNKPHSKRAEVLLLFAQVSVPDRATITTANAETCVVKPAALQPLIDAAVKEIPSGEHSYHNLQSLGLGSRPLDP